MEKREADRLILAYTRKLYGFALSKTGSLDRAEELAARITLEVYASLLKSREIYNPDGYVYRVASHVWARTVSEERGNMCQPLDDVAVPDNRDLLRELEQEETYRRLRREIAFLSQVQRKVVLLHYFEGYKLAAIAEKLNLPLGTVKWHLYDAKKCLKEGINSMKGGKLLEIQPISLCSMGHSGSPGDLGDTGTFLARQLTQNVAYAAYWEPKSAQDIAKALGVPAAYVEDEAARLEEYGFLDRLPGNVYQTNIYITEPTVESVEAEHRLYLRCAELLRREYVPLLFDAMGDWKSQDIYVPREDFNFLMWSVVAYACTVRLAETGEPAQDLSAYCIKRKDGGEYIAFARLNADIRSSFDESRYWACGSMNRGPGRTPVRAWQINTRYDGRPGGWKDNLYTDYASLYDVYTGKLPREEIHLDIYRRLYDKGYLLREGERNTVNLVTIRDEAAFDARLPGPTDAMREACKALDEELYRIKSPLYPSHMQVLCRAWNAGSLSAMAVMTRLLELLMEDGTLVLPAEETRRGLLTLLFSDILPK